MDEIRPTWKLAWGLWWRMLLISVAVSAAIGALMVVAGVSLLALLPGDVAIPGL